MQFVENGPDIPDALLQAHEEGRVVFFCGAGISYPAGLPGFQGLVDAIYAQVGTTPEPSEKDAYDRNQFDAMLDLLERRLPGQRTKVRTALCYALKPNLRKKGATSTHAALLQLARDRGGAVRLVTTNFDRIFAKLTARGDSDVPAFLAPLLPIPKNSRWHGIVYLHGLLPEVHDESALNRLVLTSGDFGLAYLTERWASRFVSELFRNYVVCFVGYSINDPVLRYMMDALAADRMLGQVTPPAYALGDCTPGNTTAKTIEWEAKRVVPILYEVPGKAHGHAALHRTIEAWAATYRDGVLGKERIVVNHAMARPSVSTRQDDFVGRMLWALSHSSGLPAKRFAEFDPVPPLAWLEALSSERFRQSDLARFGVQPQQVVNEKLIFSLIRRPAPYTLASRMRIVSSGSVESDWDEVLTQLARWLVRHLDNPELILWMVERGGQLHDRLIWLIESQLDLFSQLERKGDIAELARIRAQAPCAVPRPLLRTLWRLLLTGNVKSADRELDLFRWKDRLKREGLSTSLRLQLRAILAPKIALRKPIRWPGSEPDEDTPERMQHIVDWELVLAADSARASLQGFGDSDDWKRALPRLIDDFQRLLRDALDLRREMADVDDGNDGSYWDLSSISEHWQNKGFRDWVLLIELVRDAWLSIYEVDHSRAARIGRTWFDERHTTFKRLALFAAMFDGAIESTEWVDWLVSEASWWLWSVETKRETMRLLVLQGGQLSPTDRGRLETAILAGPPREMFRAGLESSEWTELAEGLVWLRLAKLKSAGTGLGAAAEARLNAISIANPRRQLANDERDEFVHWMSGTGDPDFTSHRVIEKAPRTRIELVEWLKQPQESRGGFYEDDWLDTCRQHFYRSALALCDLSDQAQWPVDRWRDALLAWSDERQAVRSWKFARALVIAMPPNVFGKVASSVAWWLEAVSKSLKGYDDLFLELCGRILEIPSEDSTDSDHPVSQAINHPIGHVTQSLLNAWFAQAPGDDGNLPVEIAPFFTRLTDVAIPQFRHGRVLLASRLIALFRVDRSWTEAHLLPLFDWKDVVEARAAWQGFLWSPRLYSPLFITMRAQFLETANHYGDLGEHARQFVSLVTFAALEPPETYSAKDFERALGKFPHEGLEEAARALVQALEAATDRREEYWVNRIQPFWHGSWPKSRQLSSKNLAQTLARLSIAARGQFPAALDTVLDWLMPLEHSDFIVTALHKSNLVSRFPVDSLRLLSAVVDNKSWMPGDLEDCLDAIALALPSVSNDHRYRRLMEYVRSHR